MPEKNPYENQKSSEIPGFVKDVNEMIDENENVEEDYVEKKSAKKSTAVKVNKSVLVLGAVVIVLLLVALAASLFFGISQKNALNEKTLAYDNLVSTSNAKIADLEKKVAEYVAKEEEAKKKAEEAKGKTYKTLTGINVRKAAGTENALADVDSLPDNIKLMCVDDRENDSLYIVPNSVVEILEFKEVDGNTWGRIADNAWIVLVYNGENFATAE